MSENGHIDIPILASGLGELFKPGNRPVFGHQRLVRHLPIFHDSNLFPVVWTSPQPFMQVLAEGQPAEKVVNCVVLISKSPPKPELVVVTIPVEGLDKFPLAPVEW